MTEKLYRVALREALAEEMERDDSERIGGGPLLRNPPKTQNDDGVALLNNPSAKGTLAFTRRLTGDGK